jgi:hypothetical protein
METNERNPRHWLLIAPKGEGKSTFGAALSPEYLVCDFDGRWKEQEKTAGGKSYRITESAPLKVVDELKKLYPQLHSYVNTIIMDSGTAVLDFIQAQGRLMEAEARANKQKFNVNDIHRNKADTMRVLRLAVLQWHCDVLWIFHTEMSMESGKEKVRTTISNTELERMKANLNAILTIVKDKNGMRGIRIEWSRYNNNVAAGQLVWDTEGMWKGVPERLDIFLANFLGTEGYNGGSYSDEWLLKYLNGKGVKFADTFEMYQKLDIKETPAWYDRTGWGAIIKRALPEQPK